MESLLLKAVTEGFLRKKKNCMKISVLIACYNSSKTLPTVVHNIQKEFEKHNQDDYEIILVNDGSPDNNRTAETIQKLTEEDSRILGISLSRNYSQLNAKMAGTPFVTGDVLVYMDDDGQCPQEHMFDLIEKLDEGFDVVYAGYTKKETSLFKKITSDLHGKLTELTLEKPKNVKISNFYAVNKTMIRELKNYKSPFPSPLGYMLQVSKKVGNVPMEGKARLEGKSNYNLKKLLKQWMTVFTNFSVVPLRISATIGFISTLIGIVLAIVYIVRYFIYGAQSGFTTLACLILILGGLILVSLGLIGDYIGRIYITISGKPQYVIRDVYRDGKATEE